MMIKQKRLLPLSLVAALVLSMALVVPAAAVGSLPDGFSGDAISAVDVTADVSDTTGWHLMTETEATTYGITYSADIPAYIAGNSSKSGSISAGASNLAVTVTEPGLLTFEAWYSVLNLSQYFFSYRIGDDFAAGESRPATNLSCTDWTKKTVEITSDMIGGDGTATIYFGLVTATKPGSYAAIRNVSYATGGRDDVVRDYDSTMGTVTAQLVTTATTTNESGATVVTTTLTDADLSDLAIGSTYRLTATAQENYQFYGWVKYSTENGAAYQPLTDGKLDVVVDDSSYYVPVFAARNAYYLRSGTNFYAADTPLKNLLESAADGEVFVLLDNYTLTEDVTIPAGVTLYVPFRAEWGKEEDAGKYHLCDKTKKASGAGIADEDETYIRLTVDDRTMTVNGDLIVGSVIGYAAQNFQGHVSGSHGRITVEESGKIMVEDGGTLTCYGIVDGSGLVRINDGGVLKESFIICDFSGGSNSAELFGAAQMPFKRFSMQSVQCTLKMNAAATLKAMMNAWAMSSYNEAEVILVGDDDSAAFCPDSSQTGTLVLTRTYDAEKALRDGGDGLTDVTGIGRTEWTFSSGLTFQPLTVSLAGFELDTGASDFTIPYNFKINLVDGTYDIPYGVRLMPGAELTIDTEATATVGGRLLVMDGLVQTDMSGDRYPTRDELTGAGFSGSAELTVNGTLIMESGSSLGGLVKSDGGGTLEVNEGAYVSNSGTFSELDETAELTAQSDLYTAENGVPETYMNEVWRILNWVQQDGAKGYYDENTTWFNLPARIYTSDGVKLVETGKTYVADELDSKAAAEYTVQYLYVEDGVFGKNSAGNYVYLTDSGMREMSKATESLSRSVTAAWSAWDENETTLTITPAVVGSGTEGTLTHNVTVICKQEKNGTTTELSELKAVVADTELKREETYVFLVKYTVPGETAGTTVKLVNGVYSIPSAANGVTIEAALLGDISGDGKITIVDALRVQQKLVNKFTATELGELAANVNGDTKVTIVDALRIQQHLLGKFDW